MNPSPICSLFAGSETALLFYGESAFNNSTVARISLTSMFVLLIFSPSKSMVIKKQTDKGTNWGVYLFPNVRLKGFRYDRF